MPMTISALLAPNAVRFGAAERIQSGARPRRRVGARWERREKSAGPERQDRPGSSVRRGSWQSGKRAWRWVAQSMRGSRATVISADGEIATCPRVPRAAVRMTSGFGWHGPLTHRSLAFMHVVFLGPGLCLQLPPDGPSRFRPCCWARISRHQSLQRTFTFQSLPGRLSPPGSPAPPGRCVSCLSHRAAPSWARRQGLRTDR